MAAALLPITRTLAFDTPGIADSRPQALTALLDPNQSACASYGSRLATAAVLLKQPQDVTCRMT